ncbi:kinase D-interacting substrate of 220 kDa B isoform X2 [Tribolium castaneum]|uniref:kinase D-interacting substrate of 220 kDa B isoform X2 n=1 Tax=Tribolium castaneum TaxID=7070 RepID=UPI00046C0057|nr:PREDICTED: kinase D-interacting substrate of 220 kDa isoform X3 [Tribolium castaneum]|eukprot:XP_015838726.1 PREDICTED: kinase D-interacting substrate of 220 kDa isoform X3 [Tribolium castaneum]
MSGPSSSPKQRHSIAGPHPAVESSRRRPSFLTLHIPETNWRGSLSQLHLPTFTLTAPEGGDQSNKKFSFGLGIRRHSHTTLHRSESMVSLCFRTLSGFINEDNLQGLKNLLESKQVQVDDRDENGTTALMLAATKGRSAFVRELLAYGADANAEDCDSWTALLCASKEGHADIVLQLLEHNANIEHRDMGNWTSLMWATYKGRIDVVHLLLEKGAEVNAHGNYHISSLLWAAGRGYTEITEALISHGAKVNVGDKYGTTALVWASRKGYTEIVAMLLKAGANVDTAGMYSWTALLMATQGNFVEVVNLLLEYKPNVNALDKDGCSALTIACKEGNNEIVTALIAAGAYINIQDRFGDTNLIHAVKGGHRACVESLLKKYADVDIAGKDQKTAIYMSVEKGNIAIVKLLLSANPDLEIATKDGDTPLLKAVRSRNAEIVQLLLDKKAKVSAADKKGDTALHIAMRARSKGIVEILLRNPKHSQLLYRPNRAGETPYNIDINHQKTILGQIFGARRLNTNEDNENMLGYDLYSSALADILSEPSLSMPITVGLYAKWGSGKSFLLNKLREEMKNFAREWVDPVFQFTSLMFLVLLHLSLIVGTIVGLSVQSWIIGLSTAVAFLLISYIFLALVWFANKRYDWDWPYNFNVKLTRKLNNIKLILQVLFCNPPGAVPYDGVSANPIRFYFTDQTRVSSTAGGENSVVQMIGSLYDAIENDYGALATRLYRAFKPKPVKSSSTWKLRKLCCVPYVAVFEIIFLCVLVGTCALTVYLVHVNSDDNNSHEMVRFTLQIVLITDALLLGVAVVANVYTWSRLFKSVLFSQRRHLQRTIARLETLKSEGFLQALRQEVNLMKDMVKCLDSLSSQQTRLVIVVDGLDSCEQDKVLLILDTVHMLFSDANSPFIVILAIDPHVIAKAVEMNTRRLFSENNIGGHNYLSNMVHLPFYLQNSGLRKVKVAQQTAQAHRKQTGAWTENEESLSNFLARSSSSRRLSSESALMSSQEKLKPPGRKNSRKLKLSESVASSIGSNLNKIGGAQDLTKMLLTDDYFSDVNPRSMRRLMNVVYITGRLLKAFQIDFNWYRLASWINITEQWPFRTSWIIYHYELYEDGLDDNTSLKSIFDKIRPHIPTVKDTEPLLELDRDEKKFDIFLTFHRSSLLVSDLKIFLPFTINLDPYLKKVIKEETQSLDDDGLLMTTPRNLSVLPPTMPWSNPANPEWISPRPGLTRRNRPSSKPTMYQQPSGLIGWSPYEPVQVTNPQMIPLAPVTSLAPEVFEKRLSTLSVDGVCKLLGVTEDLNSAAVPDYCKVIKQHNISGKVLLHCDLDELKKLLNMSFGDWEMFKVMLISLREHEVSNVFRHDETTKRVPKPERKTSVTKNNQTEKDSKEISQRKQTVMEKQYQVTLEEQMICGALQTLNEEACEDVLEETEEKETKITIEPDVPQTSVIPPSPDSNQDFPRDYRSRTNSSSGVGETEFVLLQSSPIGHMHWQPISISIGGNSESLSEHSSRCSSQLPSPVTERRFSNGIKLSNLKSSDDAAKKGRHVVIKTDCGDPSHISVVFNQSDTKTPLLQEFNARPSSLQLVKTDKPQKPVMRNRSKSIDCQKKKLHRLKEKLLHSSPELNENASDNESTPLVSEVSTPSKSGQSSEINSNSFPLSPVSQKSLSPEIKHRQTRSEQNLTDTTDVSPVLSFHDNYLSNVGGGSSGGNSLSPRVALTRTMSECTSISGMISSCSNVSLRSRNSQSSGHLSRQNALDSEENLADCYCDPSRGG